MKNFEATPEFLEENMSDFSQAKLDVRDSYYGERYDRQGFTFEQIVDEIVGIEYFNDVYLRQDENFEVVELTDEQKLELLEVLKDEIKSEGATTSGTILWDLDEDSLTNPKITADRYIENYRLHNDYADNNDVKHFREWLEAEIEVDEYSTAYELLGHGMETGKGFKEEIGEHDLSDMFFEFIELAVKRF